MASVRCTKTLLAWKFASAKLLKKKRLVRRKGFKACETTAWLNWTHFQSYCKAARSFRSLSWHQCQDWICFHLNDTSGPFVSNWVDKFERKVLESKNSETVSFSLFLTPNQTLIKFEQEMFTVTVSPKHSLPRLFFLMLRSIFDTVYSRNSRIVLFPWFLKCLLKHFIKGLVFHSVVMEMFRSKSMKWN